MHYRGTVLGWKNVDRGSSVLNPSTQYTQDIAYLTGWKVLTEKLLDSVGRSLSYILCWDLRDIRIHFIKSYFIQLQQNRKFYWNLNVLTDQRNLNNRPDWIFIDKHSSQTTMIDVEIPRNNSAG